MDKHPLAGMHSLIEWQKEHEYQDLTMQYATDKLLRLERVKN